MPYRDPEKRRAMQHIYVARWKAKHPERIREHDRRHEAKRTANPRYTEARRVHSLTHYYLKTGKLIRPDQCEECGVACKPDAAHVDYSRPLEVRWLCRPCHYAWDKAEPKTLQG